MNKQEFLATIQQGISMLSQNDINKSLEYYSEMIDDYIEDGMSEEEAVAAMGNPYDIVNQILMNTPLPKLVQSKAKPSKKLRVWEIIFLILGSPIWISLLLAVFVVFIAIYIVFWVIAICLYIVDISFAISSLYCIISSIMLLFTTNNSTLAIFYIGASLICFGLSILIFFTSNQGAKSFAYLHKKFFLWIKSLFIKKERI